MKMQEKHSGQAMAKAAVTTFGVNELNPQVKPGETFPTTNEAAVIMKHLEAPGPLDQA